MIGLRRPGWGGFSEVHVLVGAGDEIRGESLWLGGWIIWTVVVGVFMSLRWSVEFLSLVWVCCGPVVVFCSKKK